MGEKRKIYYYYYYYNEKREVNTELFLLCGKREILYFLLNGGGGGGVDGMGWCDIWWSREIEMGNIIRSRVTPHFFGELLLLVSCRRWNFIYLVGLMREIRGSAWYVDCEFSPHVFKTLILLIRV